jgi:hypothetical protein
MESNTLAPAATVPGAGVPLRTTVAACTTPAASVPTVVGLAQR